MKIVETLYREVFSENPSTRPLIEAGVREQRFSHIRDKVTRALERLLPRSDEWISPDIIELGAIFELARLSRFAETKPPLVGIHAISQVLDKLGTSALFRDIPKDSHIEMEQNLRLFATTLRLYKYEGIPFIHPLRDLLYNKLKDLQHKLDKDHNACPSELQIEKWNIRFLIQHCLYLLMSIDDSHSLATVAARRVFAAGDAALRAYGGQYRDVRKYTREAMKRWRTRPKWHDEYMKMEDICFTIYARRIALESEPSQEIAEVYSEEKEAVHEICNTLEDLLNIEPSRLYALSEGWRTIRAKAVQASLDMGSYEEHAEYFKYGLLDLMYQLLFRIRGRAICFPEILGAVKAVLETTERKANCLHRKAVDIFRHITALGAEDERQYGETKDCNFIESCISIEYRHDVERPEFSIRQFFF